MMKIPKELTDVLQAHALVRGLTPDNLIVGILAEYAGSRFLLTEGSKFKKPVYGLCKSCSRNLYPFWDGTRLAVETCPVCQ